ncbi:hypothetical protein HPC49_16945 [Pyxidicoccus fallax]|uniref:Uncharacterized protein n=1 Tax=Pyxidicoccus fallax TaxID=394095 RepID=A0A848LNH5_9BACT|nr:hypothetical protein [Pyxidicoccus fallax]NMO19220.1 hypothetical protein [Pyxidicoccus fallax]NPC79903.1 hypothetical protein [Pyxidicoccus fallax]
MNSRLLIAFLCLAAVAPGCVVHDHDDDDIGYAGDVTFRWTFEGFRCDEDRDIAGVNIHIPGERLEKNGEYPCSPNGFDGIVLHDFAPGVYNFTIDGVSWDGDILYTASGTFRVDGDVTVDVDMVTTAPPASFAKVSWLFPPNNVSQSPNCTQAGVVAVDVRVDEGDWERIDCARGYGSNRIESPPLAPGEHTLEFVAVDRDGNPWYYYSDVIITEIGVTTNHTASMWAIGGASIRWDIFVGSTRLSCADARISEVRINFIDVFTGELVYGLAGDAHGCNDAPVVYEFLRPGRYEVAMQARSSDGNYSTPQAERPVIEVKAHQFPGPNAALPVPLVRQ